MGARFHHSSWLYLALSLAGVCATGCGRRNTSPGAGPDSGIANLTSGGDLFACPGCICKDPKGDEDSDGIKNGDEGCLTGRDSDGDKIPDWQDFDSDDDGIYDALEKGEQDAAGACQGAKPQHNSWPCDTDGDKLPDYLDVDADNDGLLDGEEDANGDGRLGCCLTSCGKPGSKQRDTCVLNAAGCGPGQACVAGACMPPEDFRCSDGESDPTEPYTFDGLTDAQLGAFVCRAAAPGRPGTRVQLQKRSSQAGDWHVALPLKTKYTELAISGVGKKEAAATIDLQSAGVAGFVLSRATTHVTASEALAAALKGLHAALPGGAWEVSQVASGTHARTHDAYDAVLGTTLKLSASSSSASVSVVRDAVVAALLGRTPAQLSNLPAAYGSAENALALRLTTVKRFEFKKNSQGYLLNAEGKEIRTHGGDPVDTGYKAKWRLVLMGALARWDDHHGPKQQDCFELDDLADGTALATYGHVARDACDALVVDHLAKADIIWVIDESGSMDDKRASVISHANGLFSRALASGLDFRMGITGVNSPQGSYASTVGRFCSTATTDTKDSGGVDRFLLPTEQTIFSACIKNPPGFEGASEYGLLNAFKAVKQHLPRAAGAPDRVRPDARLVIIVASDEPPQSLTTGVYTTSCPLTAADGAKLDAALKPYLGLFSGADDPQASSSVHFIGGVCNSGCSAQPGIGYLQLVQKLGGQIADICQQDLGASLGAMIDEVAADASPLKLKHSAVSSTVAVVLDGVAIKRSRSAGFDYNAASNTLVLINTTYSKGSKIIASYKRWQYSPGCMGP
jgi:hypothetical protein